MCGMLCCKAGPREDGTQNHGTKQHQDLVFKQEISIQARTILRAEAKVSPPSKNPVIEVIEIQENVSRVSRWCHYTVLVS